MQEAGPRSLPQIHKDQSPPLLRVARAARRCSSDGARPKKKRQKSRPYFFQKNSAGLFLLGVPRARVADVALAQLAQHVSGLCQSGVRFRVFFPFFSSFRFFSRRLT